MRRKSQLAWTVLLWGLIGLPIAGTSCPQQDGGDVTDGSDSATVDRQRAEIEFSLHQAAGEQLAQLLDSGMPTQEALESLAASLRQDLEVVAAAMQEDGAGLWVACRSGAEHVYWVVEEDDLAVSSPEAARAAPSNAARMLPPHDRPGPSAKATAGLFARRPASPSTNSRRATRPSWPTRFTWTSPFRTSASRSRRCSPRAGTT